MVLIYMKIIVRLWSATALLITIRHHEGTKDVCCFDSRSCKCMKQVPYFHSWQAIDDVPTP